MDSEHRSSGKPAFWPALWVPIAVFIAGLVATASFADIAANQARSHSEAIHQVRHQKLVQTLSSAMAGNQWSTATPGRDGLEPLFDGHLTGELGLRIDSLERHSKRPLLQIPANMDFDPGLALRTEVGTDGSRWILTTVPLPPLDSAARAGNSVWVAGVLLSTLAAAPALLLCRRLSQQGRRIRKLERLAGGSRHLISNLKVEKSAIRRALNDSEQRSRDLVLLSGAIIWELDESGHIGFTSPQVVDLLNRAPADLAGRSLEILMEAESRANYRLALQAAWVERSVERIDLNLLDSHGEPRVPVTLRIRALDDPLHGLAGYRISALSNPADRGPQRQAPRPS